MPDPFAPDLLVIADRIHPLGGAAPVQALLVRNGRVRATGSESGVRPLAGPGCRTLRLSGATVTPGLTDAHVHLTAWALGRRLVQLHGSASAVEAAERVRARTAAGGDGWIVGGGWNANLWGGFPTREPLDAVAPHRPVVLHSQDLHAAWVNSVVLNRAGIGTATPDPEGGRIVRDAAGRPTGILLEAARELLAPHLPTPGAAATQDALADAQEALHQWGITGVHSVEPSGLSDFQRLLERGRLRLRVVQSVPLANLEAAAAVGVRSGFGGEWLRVGGVKMFLDGALGSRTALLREPYVGSEDRGVATLAPADFRDAVRRAAEAGLAATVHAIGDAAVARALETLASVPPPPAMPHRIEHLQLCPPELWKRVGSSGVVASVQPVHLRTDVDAAERHWGHARSRGAYPFAALLGAGTTLAFGSDVPVETPDPRQGLYAAVRRTTWTGAPEEGWYPEHVLTAEQALRAYTEGPAIAAGLADRRGRLCPGYDADLVAWDRDPLACGAEELLEMQALLTMVGGDIVFGEGEWT